MPANQENPLPGCIPPIAQLTPAMLNEFGDLVCPHCRVNIITPLGYRVSKGVSLCLRCRRSFEVTLAIADHSETISATRHLRRSSNVTRN